MCKLTHVTRGAVWAGVPRDIRCPPGGSPGLMDHHQGFGSLPAAGEAPAQHPWVQPPPWVRQWLQPTHHTTEFQLLEMTLWLLILFWQQLMHKPLLWFSLRQIYEFCTTHAPFRVGNYCLSRSCSNSHLHLNNLNETNNGVAEDWICQWVNIWM